MQTNPRRRKPRPAVSRDSRGEAAPVSFESAVEHASRAVPIFAPPLRVEEARAALAGHIIVCEQGKFLGLVRIEDFCAADDPAFGSGPLATVIQDLLSILIYFGIARVVL